MDFFKGKWEISRQLNDYLDPSTCGVASGEAIFHKFDYNLSLLSENVKVNWANGSDLPATRSYLFKIEPNQDGAYVLSIYNLSEPMKLRVDGLHNEALLITKKPMHRFDEFEFTFGFSYESLHVCGRDEYNLFFTLCSADSFSMDYEIKGPNKNCYIKSLYMKSM